MNYILAILLIGLVILFHELGHFVAARIVGIPIKIFSVGFGPALWKREKGVTEYRLALIPIGGYVMPAIDNEEDLFQLSVYQRVVMTIGGPLASLILAVISFSLINIFTGSLSLKAILIVPVTQTLAIFYQMLLSLPGLFSNHRQLSGVVGIVAQWGQVFGVDLIKGFSFTAIISINLAFLNLLPLPIFDGGKIMLYLLEKIHPVIKRLHFPLAITSWVLMMGLMVYVTVLDIGKFFI